MPVTLFARPHPGTPTTRRGLCAGRGWGTLRVDERHFGLGNVALFRIPKS